MASLNRDFARRVNITKGEIITVVFRSLCRSDVRARIKLFANYFDFKILFQIVCLFVKSICIVCIFFF